MDPLLSEAIEPVLRDLRAYGLAPTQVEDEQWTDDPHRPSLMIWGTGHGSGVAVSDEDSLAHRIAEAADRIQEWAIDELWGTGPVAWPPCPLHPDTHPMWVRVEGDAPDQRAVWACPAESATVAEVGTLDATPPATGTSDRRGGHADARTGGLSSLNTLGRIGGATPPR